MGSMSSHRFAWSRGGGLLLPLALVLCAGCPTPTPKPPPATESISSAAADNAEGTPDDGSHGPLHAANMGKILFSQARLADDAPADAPLLTEIQLGDRLYAKAFLARAAAAQLRRESAACGPSASGWVERTISVDGKAEATIGGPLTTAAEYEKQTTWIVDLAGIDSERAVIWPNFRDQLPLAYTLANLGDGTHTVEIVLGARCRAPKSPSDPLVVLAKGTLTVKVAPKGRAAYAAAVGPFIETNIFKSAADTKAIVAAAAKQYAGLFLDFRGLEDDWKVSNDDKGNPLVRKLPSIVTLKNPPNCTVQGVEVVEDWVSGKWTGPQFQNVKDPHFDPQTISCSILQAKPPKPK